MSGGGFYGGSDGKESSCNAGDLGSIPGSGRSPEKGMATHPNILAWKILWTGEPGAPVYGVARVGPDLVTKQQQQLHIQSCHFV